MSPDLVLYLALFVVSLAGLLKGADWFVNAAEEIGLSIGISPFIIGVTIVAFGTSLPELASSVAAVFADESAIVVGNVVGSNIANILLVLGLTAILGREIILDYNVMDVDMPLLVGSAIFLWFALLDLHLSNFEAILFLVGLIAFLVNSFSGKQKLHEIEHHTRGNIRSYLFLVIGGFFVYLGAHYVIVSIENLSVAFNINTEFIALTGVALGTSLPEVVVSINAARRGKSSIAVGNVIGSNIFNTFAVMGIPGIMTSLEIPENIVSYSLPMMVMVTFLFALVCISKRISRLEGIMLLGFYIYFMVELFNRGMFN